MLLLKKEVEYSTGDLAHFAMSDLLDLSRELFGHGNYNEYEDVIRAKLHVIVDDYLKEIDKLYKYNNTAFDFNERRTRSHPDMGPKEIVLTYKYFMGDTVFLNAEFRIWMEADDTYGIEFKPSSTLPT